MTWTLRVVRMTEMFEANMAIGILKVTVCVCGNWDNCKG